MHPCRSPMPIAYACDLPPPKRTQTSETEYSDLTASNRRPSTRPVATGGHSGAVPLKYFLFPPKLCCAQEN